MVGLPHIPVPPPPSPSPMVLLQLYRCSSIPIGAPQSLLTVLRQDWTFNSSCSAPYCPFGPYPYSSLGAPRFTSQPRLGSPQFYSGVFASLPFRRCSPLMGCSAYYALLDLSRHSLAWISAPHFHSALHHHHQHSLSPPRTPHQALLLCFWCTSLPPEFIILPFNLYCNSPRANLDSNLLDITH